MLLYVPTLRYTSSAVACVGTNAGVRACSQYAPMSNLLFHWDMITTKLTTSRGSPVVYACHVYLTSISVFVSYTAHGMTDRQNDHLISPALAEEILLLGWK